MADYIDDKIEELQQMSRFPSRGGDEIMILVLTKKKLPDNKINCKVTVIADGPHNVGELHFPNQITWTRFYGALQRGCVGMRELEVRLDVAEADEPAAPEKPEAERTKT